MPLILILFVSTMFKKIYYLLFVSKVVKWIILFYLLFTWSYLLIGIELVKSILFAIAFTIFCFAYNNESKWHSRFVIILMVVLGLHLLVHYATLMYWKYSLMFDFLNKIRGV